MQGSEVVWGGVRWAGWGGSGARTGPIPVTIKLNGFDIFPTNQGDLDQIPFTVFGFQTAALPQSDFERKGKRKQW